MRRLGFRPLIGRGPLGLLARCWLAEWGAIVVIAVVLAPGWLLGRLETRPYLGVLSLGLISRGITLAILRPNPWLCRLTRRVARFRTFRAGRVSVLYPAGLEGAVDLAEVARWAESGRDDLARRFGVRPPRRLRVVLFSDLRDLSSIFGQPIGGTVLVAANTVLLAADWLGTELLRHELVHLFAARWNANPPPLFQEGLAVWLEGIDRYPLTAELRSELAVLLDDRHFFSEGRVHFHYGQAGVFTGYLIRRFGWDLYLTFYLKADRSTFPSRFAKHYGMSLEAAWLRCRDETGAMARLDRRLREDELFVFRL